MIPITAPSNADGSTLCTARMFQASKDRSWAGKKPCLLPRKRNVPWTITAKRVANKVSH